MERAAISAEQLDGAMPTPQSGPATQVRAAVGVVGTIVAGLPPSAEQPRRDPSARSPRLTAISEAEPMAVDAPDAQLESQPSHAAGKAAGKGGEKVGAGKPQATTARKRSGPAAQPEAVPEQNERTKRRKRSPAAKPDVVAAVDGSPSDKATALGTSGKKTAAVSLAADAAEDDAAANPEPGDYRSHCIACTRPVKRHATLGPCTVNHFPARWLLSLTRRVFEGYGVRWSCTCCRRRSSRAPAFQACGLLADRWKSRLHRGPRLP